MAPGKLRWRGQQHIFCLKAGSAASGESRATSYPGVCALLLSIRERAPGRFAIETGDWGLSREII